MRTVDELTVRRAARAGLRRPASKNPLLRALVAFFVALVLVALQITFNPAAPQLTWLSAGAFFAVLAGVLILTRSTAIRRIEELRYRSSLLEDDLAHARLYWSQVEETLEAVRDYRTRGVVRPDEVVERVLESASVRCRAAIPGNVRLALIETTSDLYVLRYLAGDTDGFKTPVGTSCPSDRPLAEVLNDHARHWHHAPLTIEGRRYELALMTNSGLSEVDGWLVQQLAVLIELATGDATRAAVTLRAV